MAQTVGGAVAGFVFKDFIGSIIAFPVWWYTRGFVYFVGLYSRTLRGFANQFGVGVWIKNMFVPMYGSYDFTGRLISFIIRLAQSIVRGFIFLIVAIVCTVILVVWIFLPVIAGMALLTQLVGFVS